MVRRRRTLESSLELMADQRFQGMETMGSFHRLAQIVKDQFLTGECLELLDHLGEESQPWTC